MNGRDVMGLAQTGTGKTLAFGVPLVAQMLDFGQRPDPKTVRGLVLAPTRELAQQIAEQFARSHRKHGHQDSDRGRWPIYQRPDQASGKRH